jgi:transcriptional regulator with XRE-family HTH domain
MLYGQRLKRARDHAKLTQAKLAELAGVSQPTISQLEQSESTDGSVYTAQFAYHCGVSAIWLADEIGEMIPTGVYVSEPRVAAIATTLLHAMEEGREYLVESTQKNLDASEELAAQATARAKGKDC